MRIMIVTDAWEPQVNGVVRTLKQTRAELENAGHVVGLLTPLEFRTLPCPTYPEIRLSLFPARKLRKRLEDFRPDAIHIATEGPLGMAARKYCLRHQLPFTTAYHSRFPEYVQLRFGIPLAWSLAFPFDWGAHGVWWGLASGLACAALGLTLSFQRKSAQLLQRRAEGTAGTA